MTRYRIIGSQAWEWHATFEIRLNFSTDGSDLTGEIFSAKNTLKVAEQDMSLKDQEIGPAAHM